MKIVKPRFLIETPLNEKEIFQHLEKIGRVCYKSESAITDTSAKTFITNIFNKGHESILEHFSITVRFICDRGISHELVRHRLASYAQESTRYCNYSKDKYNGELTFIQPCFWRGNLTEDILKNQQWLAVCKTAEACYFQLLKLGATPQEARSILPNSLKTEVIMTCNLREWRHIFKLRCDKSAHPQMRELMIPLLKELKSKISIIFDDIEVGDN